MPYRRSWRYTIESHVPAEEIQRLLQERPKAKGLSVPGMPIGSPGMEMGNTPGKDRRLYSTVARGKVRNKAQAMGAFARKRRVPI